MEKMLQRVPNCLYCLHQIYWVIAVRDDASSISRKIKVGKMVFFVGADNNFGTTTTLQ